MSDLEKNCKIWWSDVKNESTRRWRISAQKCWKEFIVEGLVSSCLLISCSLLWLLPSSCFSYTGVTWLKSTTVVTRFSDIRILKHEISRINIRTPDFRTYLCQEYSMLRYPDPRLPETRNPELCFDLCTLDIQTDLVRFLMHTVSLNRYADTRLSETRNPELCFVSDRSFKTFDLK